MRLSDLIKDKDGKDTISKGAVLLWVSFFVLFSFWVLYAIDVYIGNEPSDAPDSLQSVFIFLLGYILYPKTSKIVDALNRKNDKTIEEKIK
jgi:hypothetical protein